jgi:arsenate reductase
MSPPRTITHLAQPALRQVAANAPSCYAREASSHHREYLQQPPGKSEVDKLSIWSAATQQTLIRDGEPEFKALKKKKAELDRVDIAKAIAAHPILLQRPIVVAGSRAAIGRPPEAVLPLLK